MRWSIGQQYAQREPLGIAQSSEILRDPRGGQRC
jgi:hypothetical protein